MIKFRTGGWGNELIKAVKVDRETETSVFIGKDRHSKRTLSHNYFDTWEDAKAFLLEEAESEAIRCRWRLQYANGKLGNVRGLKNPEEQI